MKRIYQLRVFEVGTIDDDYQEIIWYENHENHDDAKEQYDIQFDKLVEGEGVELVEFDEDENGEQHNWEGLKGHFMYVKEMCDICKHNYSSADGLCDVCLEGDE